MDFGVGQAEVQITALPLGVDAVSLSEPTSRGNSSYLKSCDPLKSMCEVLGPDVRSEQGSYALSQGEQLRGSSGLPQLARFNPLPSRKFTSSRANLYLTLSGSYIL